MKQYHGLHSHSKCFLTSIFDFVDVLAAKKKTCLLFFVRMKSFQDTVFRVLPNLIKSGRDICVTILYCTAEI